MFYSKWASHYMRLILTGLDGRQIVVRCRNRRETNEPRRTLSVFCPPTCSVIADAARPIALAGVMGGRDSEVSAGTVNVLLESARFDLLIGARNRTRIGDGEDSSYRFERGIDPMFRAGQPTGGATDSRKPPAEKLSANWFQPAQTPQNRQKIWLRVVPT